METYVYFRKPRAMALYPEYGTEAEKIDYVKKNRVTSYQKVAMLELNSESLDVAYQATQNGMDEQYSSWVDLADQYEDNITYVPIETRSSMVGDIFRKNGVDFIVDTAGFLEVK